MRLRSNFSIRSNSEVKFSVLYKYHSARRNFSPTPNSFPNAKLILECKAVHYAMDTRNSKPLKLMDKEEQFNVLKS